MEIKYVLDITKPYDNVLMMYGDHYQVQRYTQGVDTVSVDQWELEDPDNGWIPDVTGTNLSGDPDRLYYLHDDLGSTTKLIGEDGKTSARYNYDEFGRPLSFKKFDQNWPGPDNTFGYTGYQYDMYAGLWYAQARYYMPEVGRFISEDSYRGNVVEPLSLNLYSYCEGNPANFIDPSGHAVTQQDREDFKDNSWVIYALTDLTSTYEVVHTDEERNDVHELAEKVRKIGRSVKVGTIPLSILDREMFNKLGSVEKVLYAGDRDKGHLTMIAGVTARKMTEKLFGDGYPVNNNADAFRHAFWNAQAVVSHKPPNYFGQLDLKLI